MPLWDKLLEVERARYRRDREIPTPLRKTLSRYQEGRVVPNNNYTEGFRSVNVYPSTSDLVTLNSKKLPCNVIKGSYEDNYQYLNTHFLLLREDFIKPIRENVIAFLKGTGEKLHSIKIHEVQVTRKGVAKGDTCFCFEITKGVTDNSWNLRENSKRFMTGSLLIFSKDNFKSSFCGRVADNRNILHRKVLVSFEKTINLNYQQYYMMIECIQFFEPYFHVMKVLQSISCMSMQKYLVEAKSSVGMPKYLHGIKTVVSDPELNKSQLVAINAALSQELVIIQGPPGTGKTFLGLKIAKKLLHMSGKWYDESPMLIISFTNHALDQFLEGLTKSTDRILRYGGQSKNAKMENFSMYQCRKRYKASHSLRGNHLSATYHSIEMQIRELGNQMDNMINSTPNCIIDFNVLLAGVPEVRSVLFDKKSMVSWLLEDDGTMTEENSSSEHNRQPNQDRKAMEFVYENYIRNSHKPSKYCLISISIIDTAGKKLHDRIVEMKKGDEKELENEKINRLKAGHNYLVRKLQYLKDCLNKDFKNKVDRGKVDLKNPFNMPVRVRWQLYKYWLNCYKIYLKNKMNELIVEHDEIYEDYNKIQEGNNLEVMKYQKVIGMTTTSAARLHSSIKALRCPIVIVEEAAEVLEAHIIPVLTEHCQHLILIGDHQQLKPATADYEIETRHKLGVSLFERMVLNDIHCYTLNVQHRMRPEIADLITPSIYPVLHNHKSVEKFPIVNGINKCLYFITHDKPEQSWGDSSKRNIYEAEFLIKLAEYMLKNGYKPDDITILSAYLGQVGALLQIQSSYDDAEVKKVKITSVDNFQGEENKIILLSLVRSNWENKIGFLSIENRVCVALSRAREGMYVMGNMQQLSSGSQLWKKIKVCLEKQDALVSALPLKCQKHGAITKVTQAEDFDKMAPNGGCSARCGKILTCSHRCEKCCHNDDSQHKEYKCRQPCLRSPCSNPGHKCLKECCQDCGLCMYPLAQELDCGHRLKCSMVVMDDFRCQEMVYLRHSCGHKLSLPCYEADDAEVVLPCSVCKNDKDLEEIVKSARNLTIR